MPVREAALSFPILFNVPSRPLNEMTRQLDALRLLESTGVPRAELRPQKSQQRTKCHLDAAVRCGGQQNEVPVFLRCDLAQEPMALLLVLVSVDGGCCPVPPRRRSRAPGNRAKIGGGCGRS